MASHGRRDGPPRSPAAANAAGCWPEHRPDSCFLDLGLVNDADVRGDDLPAFRKSTPGLHLPPHLAGRSLAIEQCRGDRGVSAVTGYDGFGGLSHQPDRRTRRAKRGDLGIAVEI